MRHHGIQLGDIQFALDNLANLSSSGTPKDPTYEARRVLKTLLEHALNNPEEETTIQSHKDSEYLLGQGAITTRMPNRSAVLVEDKLVMIRFGSEIRLFQDGAFVPKEDYFKVKVLYTIAPLIGVNLHGEETEEDILAMIEAGRQRWKDNQAEQLAEKNRRASIPFAGMLFSESWQHLD